MAKTNIPDLVIENAKILFPNFSGKRSQYNAEGDRNFCVRLDNDTATDLLKDGWNVKYLRPREEDEEPQAFMKVKVKYEVFPPKIFMVTRTNKILLTEENVGDLDFAEIENVDLIINPSAWEINGNKGITAYCRTMYVTIREDVFADKYER